MSRVPEPGSIERLGRVVFELNPHGLNRWSAAVQINNGIATDQECCEVARLFAASPDLLAACKVAFAALTDETIPPASVFADLKRAIGKAEGK